MTGMTISSAGLDPRRKKALYRAWHRGTREMDLILGGFAEQAIGELDDSEVKLFETLLDQQDADLQNWIIGEAPIPPFLNTPLFAKLRVSCGFSQ